MEFPNMDFKVTVLGSDFGGSPPTAGWTWEARESKEFCEPQANPWLLR